MVRSLKWNLPEGESCPKEAEQGAEGPGHVLCKSCRIATTGSSPKKKTKRKSKASNWPTLGNSSTLEASLLIYTFIAFSLSVLTHENCRSGLCGAEGRSLCPLMPMGIKIACLVLKGDDIRGLGGYWACSRGTGVLEATRGAYGMCQQLEPP